MPVPTFVAPIIRAIFSAIVGEAFGQQTDITEAARQAARARISALLDQIEQDLVDLVSLPQDRIPRAERALKAQLMGMLELERLALSSELRQMAAGGIIAAIGAIRREIGTGS